MQLKIPVTSGYYCRTVKTLLDGLGLVPCLETALSFYMINDNNNKSRALGAGPEPGKAGGLPLYGFAGLGVIASGEVLLFTGNSFAGTFFTPIQWTGYILFMDALVKKRKGSSLLSAFPGEFILLLIISIASWLIFEAYNLLLNNWSYTGLPDGRLPRYIGYAWSFATISPGIFLTSEVIGSFLDAGRRCAPRAFPMKGPLFTGIVTAGAACLVIPIVLPSPYMTPLVWIGFVFFLDPINGRLGERSIMAELFSGNLHGLLLLFISGLVCGFLWEFWNYWAAARWNYNVPYLGSIKLFEMPVLGFLGFMPFAVECLALYIFIRRLIPIAIKERYLG